MSKQKIVSLTKYAEDIKNKLSAPAPAKHAGYEAEYKEFLERELKKAMRKVDELKLIIGGK